MDPLFITYFGYKDNLYHKSTLIYSKVRYNDKKYMHLSKKRNVSSNQKSPMIFMLKSYKL